jgi:hypothetical protein
VVDGVVLDGIWRLHDVSASHVSTVTLLPRNDAVHRFGSRGYHGAIVVETKGR